MIVLGFDFGMKYIGVATGQTITNTATPLTCIRAIDGIPKWKDIKNLIDQWKPGALIVGLPLNLNRIQAIIDCTKKFANRLQHKYKIPVHLVDEYLTSWEAKKKYTLLNLDKLNAESASIILEQWLNLSKY